MLSGVNNLVDGDFVHRQQRWLSIYRNNLAARYRITRRILSANRDGPTAVCQRVRIGGRHVNLPFAVCTHGGDVRFTVQRYRQCCALCQMTAGTRKCKTSGLFTGIDDVIAGGGCQRQCSNGGIHIDRNATGRSGVVAVDLHNRPGVSPVGLYWQQHGPDAIGIYHRTGNGVAVAVFNLNGGARMARPAEGWGVVIGRGIG